MAIMAQIPSEMALRFRELFIGCLIVDLFLYRMNIKFLPLKN